MSESDTTYNSILLAVTDEEFLQYGSNVAYMTIKKDTIIPLGKFAYLGTDTLKYYANTILKTKNNTKGRWVGINRQGKVLFDLVSFDNGPDYFNEGLTRVIRNGKMGYSNKYGQIVIPCKYDYVKRFKNGKAEVTFKAKEKIGLDEHSQIESDEWFEIDKQGQEIK